MVGIQKSSKHPLGKFRRLEEKPERRNQENSLFFGNPNRPKETGRNKRTLYL